MTYPPEENASPPSIPPEHESGALGAEHDTNPDRLRINISSTFTADPHTFRSAVSAEGLGAEANDSGAPPDSDQPLFNAFTQQPVRRPERIPHYGHLLLLSLLISIAAGVLGLGFAIASALGWKIPAASASDLQFNLLSEAVLYFIAFGLSLMVFPMVWGRRYFTALQWHGAAVGCRFWTLAGISLACLVLGAFDQYFMPGPSNAPIEKMMSSPGAAWLMFGFGITVAPFFEELFFRGFMLPAMCTVADWTSESLFARPELTLSHEARVALSIPAMILACGISVGVPSAIAYSIYGVLTSTGHHRAAAFAIAVLVGAGAYGALWSRRPSLADENIQLDASGHPRWSVNAMIVGSLATSLPFALLHVPQQGYALGPFLLIVLVSLILCAVRLITRSLAASTVVHSIYNLFIFLIELAVTGGFRHFDRM